MHPLDSMPGVPPWQVALHNLTHIIEVAYAVSQVQGIDDASRALAVAKAGADLPQGRVATPSELALFSATAGYVEALRQLLPDLEQDMERQLAASAGIDLGAMGDLISELERFANGGGDGGTEEPPGS